MGILGDQSPRNSFSQDLTEYVQYLKEVGKKTGLTIDQVMRAAEIMELRRRNDLYREDGDYFDEQIGGLGNILDRIASSFEHYFLFDDDEIPY